MPSPRDIALPWLVRLRWLAAAGQVLAVAVAVAAAGLRVPLVPVGAVIAVTVLSNLGLLLLMRRGFGGGRRLLPGVVLLDVLLLTALLFFTGGAANPFRWLYLIHVILAVVTLGTRWAWAVVAVSVAALAMLSGWAWPLARADGSAVPSALWRAGDWLALALVGGLTAYFTGRILAGQRRGERALAEARERAVRNEGLAALTTLAAGAAHELGTPLGTIAVVAGELQTARDPETAEDGALLRREVERCRAVVDRMRGEIAEGAHLERRHADVPATVEAVRAALGVRGARLRVDVAPGPPPAAVQPRALEQALLLLIRNGLDASDEARPVRLRVAHEAGKISFAVVDAGSGMTPEVLRQAENPFFTTKPPGKGMGLGLFLVRLTAERNDGTFVIDSRPARGTTAVLTLPAAA